MLKQPIGYVIFGTNHDQNKIDKIRQYITLIHPCVLKQLENP